MRLWSLHPKFLDVKGLSGLWREALLAKKVLQGKTKSYQNHPQLKRFKKLPLKYINTYLYHIYKESCRRGYCFDKTKIQKPFTKKKIPVTNQQLEYEFKHLKNKLKTRNKTKYKEIKPLKPKPHPLFKIKKGKIESWEKI
ncbi:pyrimidine dimer DNA glycosylase/endonuclease V [Candidatus Woesearchaeota archaeon]|nr:pyrimidine dimer DNA glycosylase/endonuclease V [Candidatus Woesearchaeota archaeon]